MPVNWKKVEKIVKKTIADLGEKATVTLQQPSDSDYDAARPYEGPADSFTNYVVQAVVVATIDASRSQRDIGIDQARGDYNVYITGSALPVHPTVGWLCIIDGAKYRITSVTRTRPGTTKLLWELVVER